MRNNYLYLLISWFFSSLGTSLILFTIPIISIIQINMTAFQVSLIATTLLLPPLLFSLSIGAIIDKYRSKKMMQIVNMLRAVIISLLYLLIILNKLNLIFLLLFCLSIATLNLFFESIIQSIIPQTVCEGKFMKINSLIEGCTSFTNILSPLIVGLFTNFHNLNIILILSILSFLISIISTRKIILFNIYQSKRYTKNHLYQILHGLKTLFKNEIQRSITLSATIFNFFHSWFFTIFAVFILNKLLFSATQYSLIISISASIGMLSVIYIEKIVLKLGYFKSLYLSLALITPVGLLISITFIINIKILSAFILVFIISIWDFLIIINVVVENTLRQIMIDIKLLSRVVTASRFISYGIDPIGSICVGICSIYINIESLLIFGICGMSLSIIPIIINKKIKLIDYNPLQK